MLCYSKRHALCLLHQGEIIDKLNRRIMEVTARPQQEPPHHYHHLHLLLKIVHELVCQGLAHA